MGEKGRPWGLPFWFGGSRGRLWRAAVGRWSFLDRRRVGPATWVPARLRAGARLSPEKAGGKSAGGVAPWTPFFMARSFPLAGFGVVGRSGAVVGLLRCPCTCPDLETFFRKMLSSIFSLENASQIGLSIPEGIAPRTDQRERSPKRASDSKRTIKPGVQGRSPGPLSPHFSGEMGTPAGQAGQRGAAPQGRSKGQGPKGTHRPPRPLTPGRG